MNLEKLSNVFGQDTIKQVYGDIASQPLQESSKIIVDFVKAARLFTAPIQMLASYQDRLTKHLEKVRNSVPEENQVEAPSFIAGPILERIKYLEDSNYLTNLYLNLLSRAIDKERVNEAHPAFYHIIDQLSPDEAMLLYSISKELIYYDYTMDLYEDENSRSKFGNTKVKKDTTSKEKILFVQNFNMYISHLKSLDLVFWRKNIEEAIFEDGVQTGTFIKTQIELTEFGSLFVKACIPQQGFEIIS